MPPRYEGGMTFSGAPSGPHTAGKWPPERPGWVGGPPDKVPTMKWLTQPALMPPAKTGTPRSMRDARNRRQPHSRG